MSRAVTADPTSLPLPAGALRLASTVRSLPSGRWRTEVWLEADGRFGGSLVELRGGLLHVRARHEGLSSLRELDERFAADLRRVGPTGELRLIVLSAAVRALDEAQVRAA